MIQLIRKFYEAVGDFGGSPQTPLEKEANEAAEKYWQETPNSLKRVMCQTETECAFADGYIAAASKYLPQGEGWISVEDLLPEDNSEVIVLCYPDGIGARTGAHFKDGKFFMYWRGKADITYMVKMWHELPPAPPIDQEDKRCSWCGGNGMAGLQSAENPTSCCKHCGGSGIEPDQQKKEEV